MFFAITVVIFLVMLQHRGSIGPFRWAGRPLAAAHPGAVAVEPAEAILARRLADGDLSPDEYLERAALLKDR